jgi:nicotinamide riboside transporter PnuC
MNKRRHLFVLRLDYLSCVLTVASTILVGRRCWEGWLLAIVNSAVMCIIGIKTSQLGFVPANMFCIAISVNNLRTWRGAAVSAFNTHRLEPERLRSIDASPMPGAACTSLRG